METDNFKEPFFINVKPISNCLGVKNVFVFALSIVQFSEKVNFLWTKGLHLHTHLWPSTCCDYVYIFSSSNV
jgi:hypothetical protein